MKANQQSEVAQKYWKGESSAAEETMLLKSDLSELTEEEKEHFAMIQQFQKQSLDADFEKGLLEKIEVKPAKIRRLNPSFLLKIAAAIALLLSVYWIYEPAAILEETNEIAAIEDPEEAYEVTKQALLLISEKLNKANTVNVGIDKFETTRQKIQQGS
ncbi:MAG: hypothetical protein AAGJ18_05295 [Bacteroidota bacterium]